MQGNNGQANVVNSNLGGDNKINETGNTEKGNATKIADRRDKNMKGKTSWG